MKSRWSTNAILEEIIEQLFKRDELKHCSKERNHTTVSSCCSTSCVTSVDYIEKNQSEETGQVGKPRLGRQLYLSAVGEA